MRDSFTAEILYNEKERYYSEKHLSSFSMVSVAGSLIINAMIITYAIISAVIA